MSTRGASVPPFPPGYRASGVLLHVTSLPSPYGIGDLGPAAFAWVDRLREAGQHWWQALPLGPTGYGDSPYQCLSSFAGNELVISPDALIEDGLLQAVDCGHQMFSPSVVEYENVVPFKVRLLETAWSRFSAGARPDLRSSYEQFCHAHALWLDDYALFRAQWRLLSGLACRVGPTHPGCARSGAARAGERDRARSLRSIRALSPGGTSRATRA
jgi:4-alpha-glucanotransferase